MQSRRMQSGFRNAILSCALMGTWITSEAQRLTWLGTSGGVFSSAEDVSDAGPVVVGNVWYGGQLGHRAFRWQNNQMEILESLGGRQSWAFGVSSDGSTVVGWAEVFRTSSIARAFRWQGNIREILPPNIGFVHSAAFGISADGTRIVGLVDESAAYWGSSSVNYIFSLREAFGSSADGSCIVGRAAQSGGLIAALWKDNQTRILGTLPDRNSSTAWAVSSDGSVVVGYASNGISEDVIALRWENDQMSVLSPLPGYTESIAYDISGDASTIVGSSQFSIPIQYRAVIWRNGTVQDLNTIYSGLLNDSSVLLIARGISDNGRYIVGLGINGSTGKQEAFLLDTYPSCTSHNGDVVETGCVDDADLLAVLFAFGNSGDDLGREDVNCDSVVDDADLLIVLFNFGNGC